MRRLITIVAVVSTLGLTGCAMDVLNTKPEVRGLEGAAPVQTLNNPATGTDITLRPGGQVHINLEANATTGYFWTITSLDETKVKTVSKDYVADPAPEGLVGGGGTMMFVFEGIAKGRSDLELSYQRSPQDVAETLKFKIKVVE